MNAVAIVGAGPLGETIARKLVDREAVRRVILVDPDEGRAKGKALDLMQSGPVEASDTRVEGRGSLKDLGPLDALVVADPPELAGPESVPLRLADFVRGLLPVLGEAPLVVASGEPASLVEAAIEVGIARDRVLGSAPIAWSAALRRLIAEETGVEPTSVSATVLGLPPHLVPVGVTLGGGALEGSALMALRKALERLRQTISGPVSLAAAAARALAALAGVRPVVLPVVAGLDGAFGVRGLALGIPVRIARGRLLQAVDFELSPRDKVAFDNAAARHRR